MTPNCTWLIRVKKGMHMLFIGTLLVGMITESGLTAQLSSEVVFRYTIDPKPFRAGLCRKWDDTARIHLQAAKHRDLIIHTVPGQWVPEDPLKARTKNYTHFLTIEDLTDGKVTYGAIAFRQDQTAIFTPDNSTVISRSQYLSRLPQEWQTEANKALNTFLRLLPILNAAIDTCRPYPPTVTYDTDDEIDRIEQGRRDFYHLIRAYNQSPHPNTPLYQHESGTSGGFYDPEANKQFPTMSYHALNPLNFYIPKSSSQ